MSRQLFSISVIALLTVAAQARAGEKITIKQLHMCCGGCAEEVETILGKVQGVTGVKADRTTRTAHFTAADLATAQKAVDALAEGGFHGVTDKKGVAFNNESTAKSGKVTEATVTGFHNTCSGCVKSFRTALKKVDGVTGDTCKPKITTCVVKGNFDIAALVEALNQEGFHVKIR